GKQVGGVVRVPEHVGRGLVDGHRPRTRGGVGLLARMDSQGFKPVTLLVGHDATSLAKAVAGTGPAACLGRPMPPVGRLLRWGPLRQRPARAGARGASKKPLRRERQNAHNDTVVRTPLSSLRTLRGPAGIGTSAANELPVAGLHRASPSAALDKS